MNDVQAFRTLAVESGIPVAQIDTWLEINRFCIVLVQDEGPLAGHLGGLPLLPDDTPWPDDLEFLAAVDCAQLPRGGTDIALPADGSLLFFLQDDLSDSPNRHRVLHVPQDTAVAERAAPDGVTRHPRLDLAAALAFSTPEWFRHDDLRARVPLADDLDRLAHRFWRSPGWPSGTIVIGGYGLSSQESPEFEIARMLDPEEPDWDAVEARGLRDWVPLAQFSHPSREDHEFDTPRFMIRRTDLAAGRFDQVIAMNDFSE